MNLLDELRSKLEARLHPVRLELEDESHRHVGHGASGAHVRIFIVAETFKGRPLIGRHRMVYEALAEHLHRDVHALSIVARAPSEVEEAPPQPLNPGPGPTAGSGTG